MVNACIFSWCLSGLNVDSFLHRLRERLIDPLQGTYYLRTLSWGALTRQWPAQYSVWQEDADADGGYRLIKTLDRCKLACLT